METGAATVTGRNEWDVTMELLRLGISYRAVNNEEELKEKFKEYYKTVRKIKHEVDSDIVSGNLKNLL